MSQTATFEAYCRWFDIYKPALKRRDVPRDVDQLLELTREVEMTDQIILDRTVIRM